MTVKFNHSTKFHQCMYDKASYLTLATDLCVPQAPLISGRTKRFLSETLWTMHKLPDS